MPDWVVFLDLSYFLKSETRVASGFYQGGHVLFAFIYALLRPNKALKWQKLTKKSAVLPKKSRHQKCDRDRWSQSCTPFSTKTQKWNPESKRAHLVMSTRRYAWRRAWLVSVCCAFLSETWVSDWFFFGGTFFDMTSPFYFFCRPLSFHPMLSPANTPPATDRDAR